MSATAAVLLLLSILTNSRLFPGVNPRLYSDDENITIKTVKLTSFQTQIPFDYYHLPFCRPPVIKQSSESLGELISGDIIHNSLYNIRKSENNVCKTVCTKNYTKSELRKFKYMISQSYIAHFLLDNLPSVRRVPVEDDFIYLKGFKVGSAYRTREKSSRAKLYSLHDHLDIKVRYHDEGKGKHSIVGFEVYSSKRTEETGCNAILLSPKFISEIEEIGAPVTFSYRVEFIKSDVKWSARLEPFLKIRENSIHWVSFIVSIIPAVIFGVIIAAIVSNFLKKDFLRYNKLANDSEIQELETGWKLVNGDVFRSPSHSTLFSVIMGIGFQVLSIFALILLLLLLKVITPLNRGGIINILIFLMVAMAFVSGFVSSYTYKMLGKTSFRLVTLYSAIALPTFNFLLLSFLELVLWLEQSSSALTLPVLFGFSVWICASVPVSFYGSRVARRTPKIRLNAPVKLLPRQIATAERSWRARAKYFFVGSLPFWAAFAEIYYLMHSVWFDQYFFMAGGLAMVFVILLVLSCELTIFMVYLQLCNGNYRWWWNSFITGGSCGMYLFIYGMFYGLFKLHVSSFAPLLLYCVYMLVASLTTFVVMGAICTFAAFLFINAIYGSIKID